MDCSRCSDWIWEALYPDEEPPADVGYHLRDCPGCAEELRERRALQRELRALRQELETPGPSAELDRRALGRAAAAVAAEEAAAAAAPRQRGAPGGQPAHARGHGAAWEPPRATTPWMLAACLLLGFTLLLGFVAGRLSTGAGLVFEPRGAAGIHATLATTGDGVTWQIGPRVHRVGLDSQAIDTLREGNTYLLAGPVGGPYEVLGVVSWDDVGALPLPTRDKGEVVVAVGPAGGWSRGKQLVAHDLSHPGVEILGRRALASR